LKLQKYPIKKIGLRLIFHSKQSLKLLRRLFPKVLLQKARHGNMNVKSGYSPKLDVVNREKSKQ